MIRYGNQLRLHAKDIERLYNLTGVKPTNIQTVDGWNRFVDQHLASIDDSTDEEKCYGFTRKQSQAMNQENTGK